MDKQEWKVEPGKHHVNSAGLKIVSEADGLRPVAFVVEDQAALIAAAPELLEACRQMMRWFEVEDDHSQMPEFMDRVNLCKQVELIAASAIAKATGAA